MKLISQRTVVATMRTFRRLNKSQSGLAEFFYERDFEDWFVTHANAEYDWNWTNLLMALRNGQFFFPSQSYSGGSIFGHYLSEQEAMLIGEGLLGRLAATASTLSNEEVTRSLELDGYSVNPKSLTLVPLEGYVSAEEENDRLTQSVKNSGLPNSATILRHIGDAYLLYADGKDHASINEARNLLQASIDDISTETDKSKQHATKLPGGTSNRIDYLKDVGFFTPDEQSAFKSAWSSLSAGSHPGVPDREQARIGLVLALEFGQLLLLKFENWNQNGYVKFV